MLWNEAGNAKYQEHTCVWDAGTDRRKRVQHLLRSIRPGDTLQLIPKARFRGWKNYVREAKIEAFTEKPTPSITEAFALSPSVEANLYSPFKAELVYWPLDKGRQEIRLLRLDSGSWEEAISCHLEHAYLDATVVKQYQSLSYCWGDVSRRQVIRITAADKSSSFPITSSLYEALRHLRSQMTPDTSLVLWIDAICINQNDLGERAQQIGIMRQIYAKASGVIVWLGTCPPYIQSGIDKAGQIMEKHRQGFAKDGTTSSFAKGHGASMYDWVYNRGFSLLELEYFKRSWVLQEVYNAQSILVYCGKNVVPWSFILRINQCIVSTMNQPGPTPGPTMPALFSGLFDTHVVSRRPGEISLEYTKRKGKFEILSAFRSGIDLDASDPRDKLFALLSFGEETQDLSQLAEDIAPNYNKSVGQVFSDFTRWWIVTHKSLRILSTVHASIGRTWQKMNPVLKFPSDKDRTSWSVWYDGRCSWAKACLDPNESQFSYQASGETEVDVNRAASGKGSLLLSLLGRKVGVVADIKPFPYYMGREQASSLSDLLKAYELLLDPLGTSGVWMTGVHVMKSNNETLREGTEDNRESRRGDHFWTHPRHSQKTGGVICHHPCFLHTEEGNVGLCPPGTRKGDVIAVLHGGKIPYLLRPILPSVGHQRQTASLEGSYYFIGECYLKGYMQGEAVALQEDGSPRIPVTVFNLQ